MGSWLQTAPGRALLAWEQAQFDCAVVDLFGYHALQLGLPDIDALRANRMPQRWLAQLEQPERASGPELGRTALWADPAALPFAPASLDMVALPHTLERSADPHQVLREALRVLVPEGRVLISGLSPHSLWALRRAWAGLGERLGAIRPQAASLYRYDTQELIAARRLRDWLRLLGFDIEYTRYGGYRPMVQSDQWLARTAWMERIGARWWPLCGAVYFVVAVKRVRGMHLLGPAYKPRRVSVRAGAVLTGRRT